MMQNTITQSKVRLGQGRELAHFCLEVQRNLTERNGLLY
jgi:hypothetical protein